MTERSSLIFEQRWTLKIFFLTFRFLSFFLFDWSTEEDSNSQLLGYVQPLGLSLLVTYITTS